VTSASQFYHSGIVQANEENGLLSSSTPRKFPAPSRIMAHIRRRRRGTKEGWDVIATAIKVWRPTPTGHRRANRRLLISCTVWWGSLIRTDNIWHILGLLSSWERPRMARKTTTKSYHLYETVIRYSCSRKMTPPNGDGKLDCEGICRPILLEANSSRCLCACFRHREERPVHRLT
jgi:hypothetical protein